MKKELLFVTTDRNGKYRMEFEFSWYEVLYMIKTFYCQRRNSRIGIRLIDMVSKSIKDGDRILMKTLKIDTKKVNLKEGFQEKLRGLDED